MSSFHIKQVVQRGIAVLAALTLAVLNPASCLIHCAIMDARQEAAQLAFFLCDHAEPVAVHAAHLPASPMPRAFYELIPSLAIIVPPLLVLMIFLTPCSMPYPARVRFQPPTPPPR